MNQKKLGEALNGVVEDSVNKVGVDLNTASASLLEYISGTQQSYCEKYRGLPGRKWKIFPIVAGAFEGGETGTESLRPVRGLYADSGR